MKKLFMALALLVTMAGSNAMGFGIGGHFGYDLIDIGELNSEFKIPVGSNQYSYSVTRDGIKNPMCAGVQLYLDLPILPIGIEAGFSGAWAKYKWSAPDKLKFGNETIAISIPGYTAADSMYSEEFSYGRATIDVTAKYYFLGLPPVVNIVNFYVGGGVGMYFITPLVSENVFIEELKKNVPTVGEPAKVDVEKLVKSNTVFGGHFVVGAQIKPPVIPLSINIDYKYNITPENDYKDETNKFSTIKASLNFYI